MYFCPFLCIAAFLCSCFPWEPYKCVTAIFYRCPWYFSEGYLTKKTFLKHLLLCWEPFLVIQGLIWGYSLAFLRVVPSYLTKFCGDVFLYSCIYFDIQCAKKNFAAFIPLLQASCSILESIWVYSLKYWAN